MFLLVCHVGRLSESVTDFQLVRDCIGTRSTMALDSREPHVQADTKMVRRYLSRRQAQSQFGFYSSCCFSLVFLREYLSSLTKLSSDYLHPNNMVSIACLQHCPKMQIWSSWNLTSINGLLKTEECLRTPNACSERY